MRRVLKRALDGVAAVTARSWTATRCIRRSPMPIRSRVYNRLADRPLSRAETVARCAGIRMTLDVRDDVQRAIYFGMFEREELRCLRDRIRPGDVCVDVGANIGFYTCHLARWVGEGGRVHAFEPEPRNVRRLVANLDLNDLSSRVSVHSVALSDRRGSASFHRSAEDHSGWGSLNRYEGFHEDRIQVATETLDGVLESQGLDDVALLKVDVEGADFAVYRGAEGALGRGAIRLVMAEWNGVWFPGQGRTFRGFTEYFAGFGYRPVEPLRGLVDSYVSGGLDATDRIVNVLFERS